VLTFTQSFLFFRHRTQETANPPGFTSTITHHHADQTREADPNLIVKRSWDFALGPIKQAMFQTRI